MGESTGKLPLLGENEKSEQMHSNESPSSELLVLQAVSSLSGSTGERDTAAPEHAPDPRQVRSAEQIQCTLEQSRVFPPKEDTSRCVTPPSSGRAYRVLSQEQAGGQPPQTIITAKCCHHSSWSHERSSCISIIYVSV